MLYGQDLIKKLQKDIEATKSAMADRQKRINNYQTDEDDCFISMRVDDRGLALANDKIRLINDGGCAWFEEYATLDGQLVNAHWCNTKYGYSLRVVMPDGQVIWTRSETKKGLAKHGLKKVECKRPAWFCFKSSASGMLGVYTGSYVLFPSDVNYATGEDAPVDPIEIRDAE